MRDKKFIKRTINLRDFKSYLVSIVIGAVVGGVCILFRLILFSVENLRTSYLELNWSPYIKYPLFVAFVFGILLLIYKLILKDPLIAGNGAEQARGMLNGHIQHNNLFRRFFDKLIGSLASLGIGLGLGREGPSIQLGSYLGIITSKIFRITPGRTEYMISAGSSAGIAAALDAPMAGPVYIIESLLKFNNYRMAICSLVSGMIAGIMAKTILVYDPYKSFVIQHDGLLNPQLIVILIIMGVVMAVVCTLFTIVVRWWRLKLNLPLKNVYLRLLIIAVFIGFIAVKSPGMLGSGQTFMIAESMSNDYSILHTTFLFCISFLFVAYSQSLSFPGGAFFPLLTFGGICGKLFALLVIHIGYLDFTYIPYFVVVGMNAAIVIIMRTPLTGLLLVAEMCNMFDMLLPALIVCYTGYSLISIVKVESLPMSLYNILLERINAVEAQNIELYAEVMPNSYFEGKDTQNISLPTGCKLISVFRDKKEIYLTSDDRIIAGDQLKCSILNSDVEKLSMTILSMASESD